MTTRFHPRNYPWAWLGIGLIAGILLNLQSGSASISPSQSVAVLLDPIWENPPFGQHSEGTQAIIWSLRIPRVILACVAGMSLAVAGTALQGLFRNPLADPALIGVTSGGSIGAIVAILAASSITFIPIWLHRALIPLGALIGAIGATLLTYQIASIRGKASVGKLLLVGIAINAMASALIGFVLFFSHSDALRSFLFWSMGSLDRASWTELSFALILILPAALSLPFFARALNIFLLGEAEAFHLGIEVKALTRQIVILAAALAGATVALTGTIAFVGLIVPHIMRMWLGPDHRRLLPASALGGAILLLLADALAREIAPPVVLPVGILTAFAGVPFFLFLLLGKNTGPKVE